MNSRKLKVGDKFKLIKKYRSKYTEHSSEGLEFDKIYTVLLVGYSGSIMTKDSNWYQSYYLQPIGFEPKYKN